VGSRPRGGRRLPASSWIGHKKRAEALYSALQ
jgi:hypothetical protein